MSITEETDLGTQTIQVMRRLPEGADEFPVHANVLAIVVAYQDDNGPMPWGLLEDVVSNLLRLGNPLVSGIDPVTMRLHDVVKDLRRVGLVDLNRAGTTVTATGRTTIQKWNGQFSDRRKRAAQALSDLEPLSDAR